MWPRGGRVEVDIRFLNLNEQTNEPPPQSFLMGGSATGTQHLERAEGFDDILTRVASIGIALVIEGSSFFLKEKEKEKREKKKRTAQAPSWSVVGTSVLPRSYRDRYMHRRMYRHGTPVSLNVSQCPQELHVRYGTYRYSVPVRTGLSVPDSSGRLGWLYKICVRNLSLYLGFVVCFPRHPSSQTARQPDRAGRAGFDCQDCNSWNGR